jgi:hypothetical protein
MTREREGGWLRSEPFRERRRAARRVTSADEPVSQVRLRAGRELTVLDISDTGLLAEGEMRLLPGSHVDVHLVTRDGRLLVRSRVVRAFVCRVAANQIRYRGALAFETPVQTAAIGYPMPPASETPIEVQGSRYPDGQSPETASIIQPAFR